MQMKKIFLFGFLFLLIPFLLFSQINIELSNGHCLINGVELSVDPKLNEIQDRINSPGEYWDGFFYSNTKNNSRHIGFTYTDEGIRVARYPASHSNGYSIPERLELFIFYQKPAKGPKKTFTGTLKINGINIDESFAEANLPSLNFKDTILYYSDLIGVNFSFSDKNKTIADISFVFWPFPLALCSPLAYGDFRTTILKKYIADNPNGKYALQANNTLDSLSIVDSRTSKIAVGMSIDDLYDFMQKFLGYPDQKLIAEGHSKYSVDQGRFMIINSVNEAKPDEKVIIKFNTYDFVFMNRQLIEYPASIK